ncbi:hypothetical protein [Deinococcus koreensis]|uniref:hypothetical protein n=1 Tax=Deinococcus koreensis TaxID=2054903 RepID=UPI0010573D72|nr:hypothetical protein [Deinococcus koreensis]
MTDPAVVPRLVDGWELRYLAPFMGREVTLSEAARELGVSLPRLHYQARKLCAEGLVRVLRVERRRRHAVKIYRAVADVFFVPFALISSESVAVAMARADLPWRPLFLRSLEQVWREHPGEWGMQLERTDLGAVRATIVPAPGQQGRLTSPEMPAVALGGWVTDLMLDFEDAKALQRDLAALLARYEGRRGSGRYLMQLRLAPLLADPGEVPNVTLR